MNLLNSVVREIVGLFVDDEFLALATLAVVGVTAIVVKGTTIDARVAGVLLLGGCLVVLLGGVWRTARS
jgi:hypothetical protein